jgi:hypothetical protein
MKTIEQLKRLVEAANAVRNLPHGDPSWPRSIAEFTAAESALDLPALLAAWEADRATIENAWHELHNLLDRNMPQDSLASAIAYMIDHSNTGWQRVCGWEKFGKMKDDLLGEKDTRIAKLEAVVGRFLAIVKNESGTADNGSAAQLRAKMRLVEGVAYDLSALDGGQQ